jgi:hypothetical protein
MQGRSRKTRRGRPSSHLCNSTHPARSLPALAALHAAWPLALPSLPCRHPQDLSQPPPGFPGPPPGPCLVLRGCQPACGAAPASLLTRNRNLVLPLSAAPPVARRLLEQSVLPAWRAACAEAGIPFEDARAAAAAAGAPSQRQHPPQQPGQAQEQQQQEEEEREGAAAAKRPPVPWEVLAHVGPRLAGAAKRYACVQLDDFVESLTARLSRLECHPGGA